MGQEKTSCCSKIFHPIAKEFQKEKFGLSHQPVDDFVKSQVITIVSMPYKVDMFEIKFPFSYSGKPQKDPIFGCSTVGVLRFALVSVSWEVWSNYGTKVYGLYILPIGVSCHA